MGLINISIVWSNSDANVVGVIGTYQRIDNGNSNPVMTVGSPGSPLTGSPVNLTPNGVPNGQYNWSITPVYGDGRTCTATTGTTPPCANITAVSAVQTGNNIVVNYTAPPGVPTVFVTISLPNGGTYNAYITNGNPIIYPIPVGLYGTFNVYLQCICDQSTGFMGPTANGGSVTVSQPIVNPAMVGTISVACVTPEGCDAIGFGGLTLNLSSPLSNDLIVQLAYQLHTPNPSEPEQLYGSSIVPSQYQAGTTIMATGYASFVIPGGQIQTTIPYNSIIFNGTIGGGIASVGLTCFCTSNPLYATTYIDYIFLHPVNQPDIQINLTPTDGRISIIQI